MGFLSSFFKQPKPRQFNYRPRYYDPAAEERERRKQEVLGPNYRDEYKTAEEKSGEEYRPGQYIQQMRVRRGIVAERRRNRKKTSMLVSFVLLIGIIYFAWWIFRLLPS